MLSPFLPAWLMAIMRLCRRACFVGVCRPPMSEPTILMGTVVLRQYVWVNLLGMFRRKSDVMDVSGDISAVKGVSIFEKTTCRPAQLEIKILELLAE